MAFCIHCGTQNTPDSVFCVSCGQVLFQDTSEPAKPKTSFRRRHRILFSALSIGLVIVLGLVLSISWFQDSGKNSNSSTPSPIDVSNSPLDAAVLTVVASNRAGSAISQGSGFILSSDGLAGSNYHVLKGASAAVAKCCNGRVFEVRTIEGADLDKDLVVFQLYERGSTEKPQNLPHVTIGSSTDLKVGDKVIAVGSPEGLENTISDGILSAVRDYKSVRYLQITAPISPGSSGGPVLSQSGRMVGIATFQLEKGQNLNFAVDAMHVRPLIDQHFDVSIQEFQSIVGNIQHSNTRAKAQRVGAQETENATASDVENRGEMGSLTGEFGGIVHNQSVNLSAEFGIIVRDDNGLLSGCTVIEPPLFGSGPIVGYLNGDDVVFEVTSSIGKITFEGRRKDGSISGSYVVEHGNQTSEERGNFTLQKAKSEGPSKDFDPATCPTDAEVHK